jgi:hypothetical protein
MRLGSRSKFEGLIYLSSMENRLVILLQETKIEGSFALTQIKMLIFFLNLLLLILIITTT